MVKILYGKPVADAIKQRLVAQHQHLGQVLKMGILLVGDNQESIGYITRKKKMADALGVDVELAQMSQTSTTEQVCRQVDQFNNDPAITGFIVQLPLPSQVDQAQVLARVCPYKDIDGLNPWSLGKLLEGKPMLVSATARGVMALLDFYGLPVDGTKAVVIGRSVLVGKPAALLLLNEGATVTVAHSHTRDLSDQTKGADLVVVAAGQPGLLKRQDVQPKAVVIDVGLTYGVDGIAGDADFDSLKNYVAAISPVPGGVGPLTVACLFKNLFLAYQLQRQSGHTHLNSAIE